MPDHEPAHEPVTRAAPIAGMLIFAGIAAASAAAHLGINFTPYLVGGLVDRYGFSPSAMGTFATAETLSFAGAMFLFAPRAHVLSARTIALVASGLIVAMQVASAGVAWLPALIAGRFVAGFGYGMLNTAVNVAAGRTASPARAISVGISLQVLLFAVMNVTLPMIGVAGGVHAMFLALAAISGLLGLCMLALPGAGRALAKGEALAAPPVAPGGWPVLAAMALFAFGTMAIWPFMERAAHAIGIPATTFGRYQSLATLLSSASNFGLTMLLARGPRRGLLEVALVICGTMCAILTTVNSELAFAIALQLYNTSWYISYPLILGLAYAHDPHGRLAVRTTATWLVAQSAGSFAAGFLAQATSGYGLVGCLGMGTCVAAVAIVTVYQSRGTTPTLAPAH